MLNNLQKQKKVFLMKFLMEIRVNILTNRLRPGIKNDSLGPFSSVLGRLYSLHCTGSIVSISLPYALHILFSSIPPIPYRWICKVVECSVSTFISVLKSPLFNRKILKIFYLSRESSEFLCDLLHGSIDNSRYTVSGYFLSLVFNAV